MKRWTQTQQQLTKHGKVEDFKTKPTEVVGVLVLPIVEEDEVSRGVVEVPNLRAGDKVHFALDVTTYRSSWAPRSISDTLLEIAREKL